MEDHNALNCTSKDSPLEVQVNWETLMVSVKVRLAPIRIESRKSEVHQWVTTPYWTSLVGYRTPCPLNRIKTQLKKLPSGQDWARSGKPNFIPSWT